MSFSIDETRCAEIETYALERGYSSPGDFARVAALRIMSMYPSKKAPPMKDAADGEKIAPGVPRARQDETSEVVESRPARAS